jgi:type II secretory pathway component PulJ
VLYRPVLLAQVKARILDRRYGVDTEIASTALVDSADKYGTVKWDDFEYKGPSLDRLDIAPVPQSRYDSLALPLTDSKLVASMQRDFIDWVYRTVKVTVRENKALKIVALPDVTQATFRTECANAARAGRDAELRKVLDGLDTQINTLERRLEKEQVELENDQDILGKRTHEEMNTFAENVFGVFRNGRTRRLTRAAEKGRMKSQARANVEESKVTITQLKEQIVALQQQREQKSQEINDRWGNLVDDVDEIVITARKSDIFVERFGVAWMPFYLVKTGDQMIDLPAFGGE